MPSKSSEPNLSLEVDLESGVISGTLSGRDAKAMRLYSDEIFQTAKASGGEVAVSMKGAGKQEVKFRVPHNTDLSNLKKFFDKSHDAEFFKAFLSQPMKRPSDEFFREFMPAESMYDTMPALGRDRQQLDRLTRGQFAKSSLGKQFSTIRASAALQRQEIPKWAHVDYGAVEMQHLAQVDMTAIEDRLVRQMRNSIEPYSLSTTTSTYPAPEELTYEDIQQVHKLLMKHHNIGPDSVYNVKKTSGHDELVRGEHRFVGQMQPTTHLEAVVSHPTVYEVETPRGTIKLEAPLTVGHGEPIFTKGDVAAARALIENKHDFCAYRPAHVMAVDRYGTVVPPNSNKASLFNLTGAILNVWGRAKDDNLLLFLDKNYRVTDHDSIRAHHKASLELLDMLMVIAK